VQEVVLRVPTRKVELLRVATTIVLVDTDTSTYSSRTDKLVLRICMVLIRVGTRAVLITLLVHWGPQCNEDGVPLTVL
jgi:hypothetical protein